MNAPPYSCPWCGMRCWNDDVPAPSTTCDEADHGYPEPDEEETQ